MGWCRRVCVTWHLISSSGVGQGGGNKKKPISSTLPAYNLCPYYTLESQFSLPSMFVILTFQYHPLQYCCFYILWLVQTKCDETTQLTSQIPPPSCYSTDDSWQSPAIFIKWFDCFWSLWNENFLLSISDIYACEKFWYLILLVIFYPWLWKYYPAYPQSHPRRPESST